MENNNSGGFRGFLASGIGRLCLAVILYIVFFGLIYLLMTVAGETALLVVGLICAFFGWKTLNSIQPSMFIWMSWVGWLIYFLVKFILSSIIGMFVVPYMITKAIVDAI